MKLVNKKEYSLPIFGRELKFIVSDLAGQSNGSVVGQFGDTCVLVTTVMGKTDKNIDYFPLTVDYEERFYAAGKIIGSRFIRREGRPSDLAVLSGRLIDRTIRPLFDSRLRRDVQVVVTILSYDEENDPDFLALLTASMALTISDIPWNGPVAGLRVLKNEKDFVLNPLNFQVEEGTKIDGTFDAFFSGTSTRINMIELGGKDADKKDIKKSFSLAFEDIKKLIEFQNKIKEEIGKEKKMVALHQIDKNLERTVKDFIHPKLENVLFGPDRNERNQKLAEAKDELYQYLADSNIEDIKDVEAILEELVNEVVHKNLLEKNKRVDGRGIEEIRTLYGEVGLLKRLHGSALFSRGETQALAVTTLAAPGSEQIVETMEFSGKRRFMLHYNFPPFSTGETGRLGMPGRREIGHGALAEKALRAVIPSQEEFPYTIRLVSEVLSSNGSSSMATTCAGTLSLMDAGVPIKKPVAGIAMGLMTHQGYDLTSKSNDFKIITDIQGPEDHYGDMDLKVAGTRDGITALQMDVKVEGITEEIFEKALDQAERARFNILDVMEEVIAEPRKELSKFAPIIMIVEIKPSQIGMVIGPGGKVINGMIETYKLGTIDIDESGKVFVSGDNLESVNRAVAHIKSITHEYEVGEIVEGEIIKLLDFGAIIDLGGGKDGMIHISEAKNGFVEKITDVFGMGQVVKAKIMKVEPDGGKISLSVKALGGKESNR